jgi:hypothetical protein
VQTPDITPVQKLVASAITLLAAVLTVATSFGVDLTTEQITALLGLATALGAFFVVADAVIRHGRAGLASTQASIDYAHYSDQIARLDRAVESMGAEPTTKPEDAQQA